MTARSATMVAIAAVCGALVVAVPGGYLPGAASQDVSIPKALENPETPRVMTEGDVDALLQRVARRLDPELRAKLAEAVVSESARAGYDPLFVLALVAVESSFRPHVSSDRGAYGLMQLKPSTFAWIAGREPDIGDGAAVSEDPVVDVRLAVRYFRWLENRFHRREEALMAYNAGPGRMRHYKRTGIPASLREYPRRVLHEYQRFTRLSGGPDARAVVLARAN
ncbi:MAG TPA: transglycosylase SLT domain-containing protein [Myxococcales bacterium]|nr:transglycosylase SLT domain-containing protein [Myxococcales bacterium]